MITLQGLTQSSVFHLKNYLILFTTVIIIHSINCEQIISSPSNITTATSNSNSSVNKNVLLMHDSSQYMTLTTTPPSAVVEVVTLNSTHAKTNETLKAQEQNQFPASPYGGQFIPGQSPIPPHLLAALQRRQQLLQAQSKFFFFFSTILFIFNLYSFLPLRRRETSECSSTTTRLPTWRCWS